MEHLEFDERYPAIFQPGGDELPRMAHTAEATVSTPPASVTPPPPTQAPPMRTPLIKAELAEAPARPTTAPTAGTRPAPVSRAARVAPAHERFVPEPELLPPAAQPAPSVQGPNVSPAAAGAVDAEEGPASHPAPETPGETGTEPQAQEVLPGERRIQWSTRSWIVCTVAALLAIAGGVFCMLAAVLIPSARNTEADAFHGMMVTPWGTVIAPAAPSLVVAGLGMLAAMFLLGSRHYPRQTHSLRAGAALVGLVGLACAILTLFAANFFPEIMYAPMSGSGGISQTQLWMILYFSTAPLTVFALAVLSAVCVVRPAGNRAGVAVSGLAALVAGGVLIAGAAFALFAPQLFPIAIDGGSMQVDEQFMSIPGWPYVISGAGSSIALAGVVIFLWGVLIQATSRRIYAGDAVDELAAEPAPQWVG